MPKRKKTEGRNSVDLATDFYSNPNANLVSFERKSKPTDYEFEALAGALKLGPIISFVKIKNE